MNKFLTNTVLVSVLLVAATSCKRDPDNLKRNKYLLEKEKSTTTYKYFNGTDTVIGTYSSEDIYEYSNDQLSKVYDADSTKDEDYTKLIFNSDDELTKIEGYEGGQLFAYIEVGFNKDRLVNSLKFYYDTSFSARVIHSKHNMLAVLPFINAQRHLNKLYAQRGVSNNFVLDEEYVVTYDDDNIKEVKNLEGGDEYTMKYTTDKKGNPTKIEYFDGTDPDGMEEFKYDDKDNPHHLLGSIQFLLDLGYAENNITQLTETYDGDVFVVPYTLTYNSDDVATSTSYTYGTGEATKVEYTLKKN